MNQNTSTPKKSKNQSQSELDQSSFVLKSLLGVSPVSAPLAEHQKPRHSFRQEENNNNQSQVASNPEASFVNDSGFISMSKNGNKSSMGAKSPTSKPTGGGLTTSSARGILRSSSVGNSTLSLLQVIQRIA